MKREILILESRGRLLKAKKSGLISALYLIGVGVISDILNYGDISTGNFFCIDCLLSIFNINVFVVVVVVLLVYLYYIGKAWAAMVFSLLCVLNIVEILVELWDEWLRNRWQGADEGFIVFLSLYAISLAVAAIFLVRGGFAARRLVSGTMH